MNSVTIRQLGHQSYIPVWKAMQHYTDHRDERSADELWLVEHDPVFTQGQAGKPEHLLMPGDIPVVPVDRGGQVTYHGPGQQVIYFLLDIERKKLGVRELVTGIENAIVDLLGDIDVEAYPRSDAPGVYVDGAKVCSIGLRIRKGKSFHGLALNVNMDLEPFNRINPCGYQGMEMTQLSALGGARLLSEVQPALIGHLCRHLSYTTQRKADGLPDRDKVA